MPLTRAGGIGTLDLCRDRPGMLSDDHLADALVAADIARDAVLYQQDAAAGSTLAELLAGAGADRIVVHQATGMIAVQLDTTVATRWPGCVPQRSRPGVRWRTSRRTWWNGGCGSMNENRNGAGRPRESRG